MIGLMSLRTVRPKPLVFGFLAVALAVVLIVLLRPREPTYRGKPLSYWVDQLWSPNPADQQNARTAL